METQPIRLDKKEFQALLKEIQTYNKLDLIAQAFQTKYAKETAGEDDEDARKSRKEGNDFLKKINESILKGINQTTKVADKIDKLSNNLKSFKPISDIKDERPVTAKEGLKSLVAGTKGVGGGIKSAFTKTVGAVSRPVETIKKAIGGATTIAKDVYQGTKDIISTPEEYSVEGGRFAKAYSKTEEGGKGSFDVGLEKFNELKAKEEKIKEVQTKIDDQKAYGFEPGEGDVKELEKLKAEYSKADIRQKQPVEAKTGSPNVINEPSEIIAEETKKHTQTFDQLLDVTKESLTELKSIRASLEGSQQIPEPLKKGVSVPTPGAAVATSAEGAGGGMSPLDLLGRGGGAAAGGGKAAGAAKAGFGAKALGALKTGGAMLGKGALVAGKAVAGAALAKPALIAAGVGLAAYGAYKGYKALTGGADGDKTTETTSEISSSEEMTVNMLEFSQKDPEGFQEYQGFIQKRTKEEFDKLDEEEKAGKINFDAKRLKQQDASDAIKMEAREKFKDKLFAAGAIKDHKSQIESRQTGGPITEGKPYLVGETGPEVVVPNKNSTVMPAQTKNIDLGGGESKKINPDGSYETKGAYGTKKYDKEGNLTFEVSPRFAGYQKETGAGGTVESFQQNGLAASQTTQGGRVTGRSASQQVGQFVLEKSGENAGIRDLAQQGSQVQPIISNNVSNNNQTTFMPVKGEPRPGSRGSALDRYNDRVAAY